MARVAEMFDIIVQQKRLSGTEKRSICFGLRLDLLVSQKRQYLDWVSAQSYFVKLGTYFAKGLAD